MVREKKTWVGAMRDIRTEIKRARKRRSLLRRLLGGYSTGQWQYGVNSETFTPTDMERLEFLRQRGRV